jgi:hypothetical protein
MKRFLVLAIAATTLYACTDTANDNAATDDRDEAPISSPSTTNDAYTPSEGDVTYRENKVRVYRDGDWKESDNEVELENGAIVHEDGRIVKENKEVELEDGEVVTRTGNFFDRTGKAIEKGWEDIKQGAREMGKDVEKGAKKAGDKVEGTVDDNDNDNK